MALGDLITIHCVRGFVPYRHFGIDVGDGSVVHLATKARGDRTMEVQRVSLAQFSEGHKVRIERVTESYQPQQVAQRALQAVGQTDYHLVLGNCEHFARGCKTGRQVSHQTERLIRGILRASLASVAACLSRLVAAMTTASVPQVLLAKTFGLTTLLGEAARHVAYTISRCANIEHRHAEVIGRSMGVTTAAAAGAVSGGPMGIATSVALYLSIDRVTHTVFTRWMTRPTTLMEVHPTVELLQANSHSP